MTDTPDLAEQCRKKLDRHENSLTYTGASAVFNDPDGGLYRYGRALRRVLAVCDIPTADPTLVDACRQAIAEELDITPEGGQPA